MSNKLNILSIPLTIVASEAILKYNMFSKIATFLKEVRLEAKKVDWPNRKTTMKYTFIVVGISFAVAVFLGGIDFAFSELLRRFIL